MRSRAAVASSSESVRSGDWNARRIATDLRPGADLLAAVDVEDGASRSSGPAASVRGDERARLDLLGTATAMSWRGAGKVITSS